MPALSGDRDVDEAACHGVSSAAAGAAAGPVPGRRAWTGSRGSVQGCATPASEQRVAAVDEEGVAGVDRREAPAHQVDRDAAEIAPVPQRRIGTRGSTLLGELRRCRWRRRSCRSRSSRAGWRWRARRSGRARPPARGSSRSSRPWWRRSARCAPRPRWRRARRCRPARRRRPPRPALMCRAAARKVKKAPSRLTSSTRSPLLAVHLDEGASCGRRLTPALAKQPSTRPSTADGLGEGGLHRRLVGDVAFAAPAPCARGLELGLARRRSWPRWCPRWRCRRRPRPAPRPCRGRCRCCRR